MFSLFSNVLSASFHGSIVILAVLLLRLLLGKAPRKYICFLWLLAGLRLLMPIELQSSLSLQPMPQSSQPAAVFSEAAPTETTPKETFAQPSEQMTPSQATQPAPAEPGAGLSVSPAVSKTAFSWKTALPYLWLGVALLFGVYTVYAYLSLRRKVRDAVKIPGGWESSRIDTAFILGFIRPKIYIPAGLSPAVRKHILAHERTHLEKGDHWFKMIGFLALSIHWFNPLVWLAYILLCKDIELACDERVVQFMELEERKSYASALLQCSARQSHFAACPVAFGEVSVKRRIRQVLRYRRPGFWFSLLAVIAVLFVAVCLLTNPKAPESTDAETQNSSPADAALSETDQTVKQLSDGLDALLDSDQYYLFFCDRTYAGGVGWQAHFVKDDSDTLWWSPTGSSQEGRMTADGQSYTYVPTDSGAWIPTEEPDDMLSSLLSMLDFTGQELFDLHREALEDGFGEKLTFTAQSVGEQGQTVARPVTVFLSPDGKLRSIQVSNAHWRGGDMFSLGQLNMADGLLALSEAKRHITTAEAVGDAAIRTEDEALMRQWGVDFQVRPDRLDASGADIWFVQENGCTDTVTTDAGYWLERKTDAGWEAVPTIQAAVSREDASYVLGHAQNTSIYIRWSDLYGPLPGGTYRMGKTFTNNTAVKSCTGYAEFTIYANAASTEDEKAAADRCFAALEALKARTALHYKASTTDGSEEVWWNGGNFTARRQSTYYTVGADAETIAAYTHVATRIDGVGYESVPAAPMDPAGKVLGLGLSTLDASENGWNLYSVKDSLYLSFFERGNQVIDFSADDCRISQDSVIFHAYWSDPTDYRVLKFTFDGSGSLTEIVHESHYEGLDGFTAAFEIFPDTAEEIDAAISASIQNLYTETFDWNAAKAKYSSADFDHQDSGFVNNDLITLSGPVDAAKRAMLEYPQLKDYLSVAVARDEASRMWRVTVKSYVDYQSTLEYRDIYLDDSGVTQLLVREGPLSFDESRK